MDTKNSNAFIKILSRYIEVSHVYFLNIVKEEKSLQGSIPADGEDRFRRLHTLLQQLNPPKIATAIPEVNSKDSKGQSITPTGETFAQTKIYQDLVLSFLKSDRPNLYNQSELTNRSKIIKLLEATPQEFLGAFPTVTYAWDTLTEIACLYFLPSKEILSSRDLIYMHSVELMQHLSRLYVQVQRMEQDKVVSLRGRFTINQLERFQSNNELVEKVLGSSSQKHISDLVDELLEKFKSEQELYKTIYELKQSVLPRLEQVENGFPDILEEALLFSEAKSICDDMVSFGIAIAYAIWLKFAKTNEVARGLLLKHCLFSTRNLLDEQRWSVCKSITKLNIEIINSINMAITDETRYVNELMIQTNNFFARKKLGEDITTQLQKWDLSKAHPRYSFLQLILLDKIDDVAFESAKSLLMPEGCDDGRPNMCLKEFEEWPILESFRKSQYWEKLCEFATTI